MGLQIFAFQSLPCGAVWEVDFGDFLVMTHPEPTEPMMLEIMIGNGRDVKNKLSQA